MQKIFILFVLWSLCLTVEAQSKKAELLYKSGNYAAAIPLLEDDLKNKSNLAIKTKLAYCYRMTNRTSDALRLYGQLVKKEKIRSEVYLYYGEALMMTEQYDSARLYFNRYVAIEPQDNKGSLLMQSLEALRLVEPIFKEAKIIPFPHNSDADDSAPVIFKNGLVFSSDRNLGFKPLKEKSGATGRDFLNLYYSTFEKDTIFEKPISFSGKINEMNRNTGSITFSGNQKTAFYAQNNGVTSKQGTYNMQIFRADADGDGWKNLDKLPFNNDEMNLMHPACSADGREVFFTSNRAGGQGGADIYRAYRNNRGQWSNIENLGEVINTPASEGFPFTDREGRLYFCSKGHASYGGFDIFVTERNDKGEWNKPRNLGKPINSPADDISFYLFYDGQSGVFSSNREGGDDDIYFFGHRDSTAFITKEMAFHLPSTTNIAVKDTLQKENISLAEEKNNNEKIEPDQASGEKIVAVEAEKFIPKVIFSNVDSLQFLLAKNKADSTFKLDMKNIFLLENINFDKKNKLDSLSDISLHKLKTVLDSFPTLKISFLIHSSQDGKEKDNLENTKKQGIFLVKKMTEMGIVKERLRSKGLGETLPKCKNDKECEALFGDNEANINRRVEIKIVHF
jgi:tetratricopeptide (TPR) repeat protein/outer membrane protein OmpA-like peptidoglycan-associated protein